MKGSWLFLRQRRDGEEENTIVFNKETLFWIRPLLKMSYLRNIYALEDESPAWRGVLEAFPNRVPRFATKAEAEEFTRQHCLIGSNPDYSDLMHSVTTLIDWRQLEKFLFPKIHEYNTRWPSKPHTAIDMSNNRFFRKNEADEANGTNGKSDESNHSMQNAENLRFHMYDYILSRLNLPIHRFLSDDSRWNTLRYTFNHMKCGIYVKIRNNQVVLFVPFVNKDYQNDWSDVLKIDSSDGSVRAYTREKAEYIREDSQKAKDRREKGRRYRFDEENLIDKTQWWANGNIICNMYDDGSGKIQFWGDHFLLPLKDMFCELCRCRDVPDCEFFLNKRDYPQLKFNENPSFATGAQAVEPYGFIYDKDDRDPTQDVPLRRELYRSYAPILSFYSSARFADIPFPPTEDWEAATGEVFPGSFRHSYNAEGKLETSSARDFFTKSNLQKFERPWEDKIPVAFFRGTATGGGVTRYTNQRIGLAYISYEWSLDDSKKVWDTKTNQHHPYLDAKITGWNNRDKKIATEPMTYIRDGDYPFSGSKEKNFVEIYKQSQYKYILYAEGHCAACRYGFMMCLGSVILKVESSCVADQMWYFPLLQPFVDHVPVKKDLSDLQEKLEWCHNNDDKCREIAANARRLYERFISRDGVLDYLQCICYEIAKRWIPVSYGGTDTTPTVFDFPTEKLESLLKKRPHDSHGEDMCTRSGYCLYCDERRKKIEADRDAEIAAARATQLQQFSANGGGGGADDGRARRQLKRSQMVKRGEMQQKESGGVIPKPFLG